MVEKIRSDLSISDRNKVLEDIQDRVLWLAVYMVDYANNVRNNPDGLKVGGHQASSASVATVMTYLYFEWMKLGDRISVKPHASPIYHAIQYLLGNLDKKYLHQFRAYHGLQSYPSRTKDPDGVDYSTGSVGLGSVAPNFGALAEEYTRSHFGEDEIPTSRFISLLGDAELDEGSVWEAIGEPAMSGMSNVLWVVDLNRQSLDRVIPGIRVQSWRQMFKANGWNVVDAKYGKRLQAAYALPKGDLLRECIDDMSNEVYQRLLRSSPETVREWLPRSSRHPSDLSDFLGQWDDKELHALIQNLGGHDFEELRDAFGQLDFDSGPNVLFAYTLKGWRLPSIGDPQNHSVILNSEQMEAFRSQLEMSDSDAVSSFPPDSEPGTLVRARREQLWPEKKAVVDPPQLDIPVSFDRGYQGMMSTQQVFGQILTEISRSIPTVAERVVTVSPDVASSTNLGGWINRVGVWTRAEGEDLPDDVLRALKWDETPVGQHLELGISENNLFMLLGQLGLSFENTGEILFPMGTLYDPFVRRGLDAFVYSAYSGAKFIIVGTPSGVSLGPEGGAHQSLITQSIGVELPEVAFYEPCFGQELEWIILGGLEQIRQRKESMYIRLSTKSVNQNLFTLPPGPADQERLRTQVLRGAYRLVDLRDQPDYIAGKNVVHIMVSGVMVPLAVEASLKLKDEGVYANVVNVTGQGPLYSSFQESVRATMGGTAQQDFFSEVIPESDRAAPVVTVIDGHPHSLAWIGSALNTSTFPLGVDRYGQSGNPSDLYKEYEIDVPSIIAACFGALGI
ncbi:MAG: pyruvate dehydrogenase [SAR202 cluster bacterium]|jgi:pyruvate dehydrogenase E1 component|nr:pyruvate dehydrogenase [SAR202 cluster bacterium]